MVVPITSRRSCLPIRCKWAIVACFSWWLRRFPLAVVGTRRLSPSLQTLRTWRRGECPRRETRSPPIEPFSGLPDASESTDAPLGDARAAAAADDEAKGFDQNNTAAIENQAISQPAANASQVAAPRVSELSPEQLVQLLGLTDRDMQDIWSRLSQIQGGREELIRIAKMKLDAARRLKNHAEADARSKSAGARGELQALSHLAAFSDLKSAQELEELATANLQSSDPDLVADSRLVSDRFRVGVATEWRGGCGRPNHRIRRPDCRVRRALTMFPP